ncbi:hypothetical protein WJX72_010545 [[Myrmecia] bisecta]|uniref:non-specific serine/threonine protein kinase n=1 Tax=[Myrmecia] bisecta TaxID=41462 RepID=A0AAW1Q5J4_9CHLO
MSNPTATPRGLHTDPSHLQPSAQAPPPTPGGTDSPRWPLLVSSTEDEEDPNEKFELQQQLGRGSYGAVFKGLAKPTGETVAIKIIPLGEQDEILEIQKEIEMLQACDHPNVVRYLGSWKRQDALWIVMEYCGGGSVSDLMHASDAPLDEELIAYICAETLAGLAYLHAMGKVHRDIKCGNILLTETGEVKLADFGVAAQLTNTMSKRNTFIGTPHWMAPEVIQESRYDGKVDVWALGISAIEMAEITPPRWAVHPMRVIFMISRDPPPRLADRDKWSLTFHDFVAQSLQKDPKSRPSAKYLLQHKFVVAARSSKAATQILPLIRQSQDHLSALAADEEKPSAPTPLNIKESSADATGRFSWRPLHSGPTGTIAASTSSQPSPARGPWAKTGMVRARLAGLSFGASPSAAPTPSPGSIQTSAAGTMVISDEPPPSRAASFAGTMRVSSESMPRVASGSFDGSGTMVAARDSSDGGDYLAALRAAAAEDDGGYMAAVKAAAAQARKGGDATTSDARMPAPPPASAAKPRSEHERLMERLRGMYESGNVVPIPFLSAAHADPLALLEDVKAPYLTRPAREVFLTFGTEEALEPDEWLRALAEVAAEDAASRRPGSAASPPAASSSSNTTTTTIGGQAANAASSSSAADAPDSPRTLARQIPPNVLRQVQGSSVLMNLTRMLAYHKKRLNEEPLDAAALEKLQIVVNDLTDALRTILCL